MKHHHHDQHSPDHNSHGTTVRDRSSDQIHDTHVGHGPRVAQDGHGGHDKHAGHSVAMFRDRFWISLALTIPTLIWTDMVQHWLGFQAPAFPGARFLPAVFGTAVFFYGGLVFLQGAMSELRARLPGMMTLISLAITVAFLFSLAVEIGFPGMA